MLRPALYVLIWAVCSRACNSAASMPLNSLLFLRTTIGRQCTGKTNSVKHRDGGARLSRRATGQFVALLHLSARPFHCPDSDARIFQGWRKPAGGAMLSRRNLFPGRKIGATFRAGKHLVRITAVLRIKHAAQRAHGVEVVLR